MSLQQDSNLIASSGSLVFSQQAIRLMAMNSLLFLYLWFVLIVISSGLLFKFQSWWGHEFTLAIRVKSWWVEIPVGKTVVLLSIRLDLRWAVGPSLVIVHISSAREPTGMSMFPLKFSCFHKFAPSIFISCGAKGITFFVVFSFFQNITCC